MCYFTSDVERFTALCINEQCAKTWLQIFMRYGVDGSWPGTVLEVIQVIEYLSILPNGDQ